MDRLVGGVDKDCVDVPLNVVSAKVTTGDGASTGAVDDTDDTCDESGAIGIGSSSRDVGPFEQIPGTRRLSADW